MNLGIYLTRAARSWPDTPALVSGPRSWTFAELEADANRLASALLARGLRPGDAVASLAWNRGELVVVEFALYKAGLARVPINARLGRSEIAHILASSQAKVVLYDAAHREDASAALDSLGARDEDNAGVPVVPAIPAVPVGPVVPVVFDGPTADAELAYETLLETGGNEPIRTDVALDDTAVLNYTSGSTGLLKAAVQTVGNRLANMRKQLMGDPRPRPDTRYLVVGPVTHAAGMPLLACVFAGTTVHLLPAWDPDAFLATIERERINATFVVPVMLTMLVAHQQTAGYDLSSLTDLRVGGAPISPARLREAVAAFGPIVGQGYGLAETTSVVLSISAAEIARAIEDDPELLQSCGRPEYDSEVRVVDGQGREVAPGRVGEIVVRGADCVREYWRAPELTAETIRDGWVHTGDLAWMREDGYVFIVDRKKDMIISGGYNIYSSEVETVLYDHPSVLEACVVGVPDPRWGEAIKAVVVLRSPAEPETAAEDLAAELIEFCAGRLDRLKKPRSIDFVPMLPLNRNGKIDRRAVRETYWAGAERRVN
ncbi:AMP-binding protein [Catenulispora sp. NF23]|uniref:class I adenylate-forming enzyme family protein n=1 Tax=Catenulispora pinistramenti TaxID=2705254 RepID=UPI001BA5102D|nr:AMP-binding protein [Catenulispora pinistramenti]MBS2533723.1 AMP-binding protein [Catenulispora pinistramenti]